MVRLKEYGVKADELRIVGGGSKNRCLNPNALDPAFGAMYRPSPAAAPSLLGSTAAVLLGHTAVWAALACHTVQAGH